MDYNIRKIELKDNAAVAELIRNVLVEHNVPKVGTAYADASLDRMYETYSGPRAVYFVIEKEGKIAGGAGIAPLDNGRAEVCELQKMYFLPELRGLGIGSQMMAKCLHAAEELGYEQCYLETVNFMKDAQKLYMRSGFSYLDGPLGDTGHNACDVWMLKELR